MTEPQNPQSTYADYRRQWAEEVAQIVPTAVPFPRRRPNAFRIKPDPNTDDESDPQD
jgi:hypothetical protein